MEDMLLSYIDNVEEKNKIKNYMNLKMLIMKVIV